MSFRCNCIHQRQHVDEHFCVAKENLMFYGEAFCNIICGFYLGWFLLGDAAGGFLGGLLIAIVLYYKPWLESTSYPLTFARRRKQKYYMCYWIKFFVNHTKLTTNSHSLDHSKQGEKPSKGLNHCCCCQCPSPVKISGNHTKSVDNLGSKSPARSKKEEIECEESDTSDFDTGNAMWLKPMKSIA